MFLIKIKRAVINRRPQLMQWLVARPAWVRRTVARLLTSLYSEAAELLDNIPPHELAKTVLFVSLRPHSREPRLAAAARLAGWNTFLLYSGEPKYNPADHFTYHVRVPDLFKLAMVSWLFRGPIAHLFALGGNDAYPFCAGKTWPLVLDLYDTVSGMSWITDEGKRDEQRAIELADGMTHRDLRGQYLHKLYGYKLPASNILIHDPLPEARSVGVVQSSRDNEIRVVSVGWISGANQPDNFILRTLIALCRAGIHVHVFVSPFQQLETATDMEGYRWLREKSRHFHLENSVHGDRYWKYLNRSHFGLAVTEPEVFGEPPTSYTMDYLNGCGSSRLTDYITAGLGIIVSPRLRFQWFLARRYAPAVVTATDAFLRDPKPMLEAALVKRAAAGKKDLSAITTEGAAPRLGEFYAQIAAQHR
jgi:hypothetical protein